MMLSSADCATKLRQCWEAMLILHFITAMRALLSIITIKKSYAIHRFHGNENMIAANYKCNSDKQ